jgi:hypothetical protein
VFTFDASQSKANEKIKEYALDFGDAQSRTGETSNTPLRTPACVP